MLPAKIALTASSIRNRHALFVSSLDGAFWTAVEAAGSVAISPRAFYLGRAGLLAEALTEWVEIEVGEALQGLAQGALVKTGITLSDDNAAVLAEFVAESTTDLTNKVCACVARDVDTGLSELRRVMLRPQVRSAAEAIRARLKRGRGLDYIQTDRSGRRWVSSDFVGRLVRGYLVTACVDCLVFCYAASGADKVVVRNPDRDTDGLIVSIAEFDEIRARIFHPNSKAWIEGV